MIFVISYLRRNCFTFQNYLLFTLFLSYQVIVLSSFPVYDFAGDVWMFVSNLLQYDNGLDVIWKYAPFRIYYYYSLCGLAENFPWPNLKPPLETSHEI